MSSLEAFTSRFLSRKNQHQDISYFLACAFILQQFRILSTEQIILLSFTVIMPEGHGDDRLPEREQKKPQPQERL